jgi:hypothetical protein
MSMQKLCLVLSLSILWTHHNYCAENQIQPIKIDNGLLTTVPGIVVATKKASFFDATECFHDGIIRKNIQFSLAELMSVNYANMQLNPVVISFNTRLFLPTIVKVQDNNLINLGSFCKQTHKEAKEACRQNKALFYPFQQGVIVYGTKQSDLDIFQEKKEDIEKMASENLKKKFVVYSSMFHTLSIEPKTEEIPTETFTDSQSMAEQLDIAMKNFFNIIRGLD